MGSHSSSACTQAENRETKQIGCLSPVCCGAGPALWDAAFEAAAGLLLLRPLPGGKTLPELHAQEGEAAASDLGPCLQVGELIGIHRVCPLKDVKGGAPVACRWAC